MVAVFVLLSVLVPDTKSLVFAAVQRHAEVVASTSAQVVFLEAREPPVKVSWTAAPTQPWLVVSPQSGSGPARLVVQLARGIPPGARTGDTAQVRIHFGDGSPDAVIDVSLTLLNDRSAPPVGAVDAPSDGFVGTEGFARISGWALDDVTLSRIEICADRPPTSSERRCADGTKAFIGEARPNLAPRPDVAAVFPTMPLNGRASWSFVLTHDALPRGRRGTTRIVATAYDSEGSGSVLGARNITLTEPSGSTAAVRWGLIAIAAFLTCHAALGLWLLPKGSAARAPDPDPRPAPRLHGVEAAFLVAVLASAALADAHGLSRGFSYDEMFSASHFIVDTPLLTTATRTVTFNNHYAFSVLSGIAARVLGTGEWALRIPAVLLGLTAVFGSWAFARSIAGPAAGVAAALVLGLMPGFVELSHSARGYSGLALITVWSTCAFVRVVRTGSRRAAAAHAVALILGFYFHLYAFWLFAIQHLAFTLRALALRSRPASAAGSLRPLWWSLGAAVVGSFVLYLPMLTDLAALMQTRQRTAAVDVSFPLTLLNTYAGPVSVPALLVLAVLLGAGVLRGWRTLEGGLLVATIAAPVLLVWLVVRPVDLHTRYVAFILPLVAVVIGIGTARGAALIDGWLRKSLAPSPVLPGLVVAMLLVLVPIVAWARIDAAPPSEAGYREALESSGPRVGPIVCVGSDAEMFDYYLGKPVVTAYEAQEIDRLMRAEPNITVVYHDVPWNSPDQQRAGTLLRRRCEETARGAVAWFSCH